MRTRPTLSWTPTGPPLPRTRRLDEVADLMSGGGVLVLSGAGLSTESGIPDYRGATGRLRTHTPMTYQDFVGDVESRRRYWARSNLGWRLIARARPNDGHRAVAALHAAGFIDGAITQNVDGLHQAAGLSAVIELHGGLDRVVCLGCGRISARLELDARLRAANPQFAEIASIAAKPDGDIDLPDAAVHGFHVVDCAECGGVLKPDVVFFGENVAPAVVRRCADLVDTARALLVLGSSLTVMSGLRFVRRAAAAGIPVAIINQGRTRGDEHATTRVDLPLGASLTELSSRLGAA